MRKAIMKQKLLISIRGKNEALDAYKAGADIIDVEYPASALGTPYPLNINAVRVALPKKALIATNIGEEQSNKSSSCQAVLGVALAGADYIKFGLARYGYGDAKYLGRNIVRTVKYWFPKKKIIPAVFADKNLRRIFDPIKEGPKLAKEIQANGVLIDTFNKKCGKTLLDLLPITDIRLFVEKCHAIKKEAWIAGSISAKELPQLWETGVDVICIRGAVCTKGNNRMAKISQAKVKKMKNELTSRLF